MRRLTVLGPDNDVSLGLGVFASVVLILAVYHKGFRKVVLWAGAVIVILALLGAGGYFAYDQYTTWQQKKADDKAAATHRQAVKDCVNRFPNADIFDQAACEKDPTVLPIPPGATYVLRPGETLGPPTKPPRFTIEAPTTSKVRVIEATVTCDTVVYDRDKFGAGDPQAIDTLRKDDTVEYVGHVTVGDQDIIRVHGRKGYVDGCVEVKP